MRDRRNNGRYPHGQASVPTQQVVAANAIRLRPRVAAGFGEYATVSDCGNPSVPSSRESHRALATECDEGRPPRAAA